MDRVESKRKNSGLANASLILGILSAVLGVVGIGLILGILAIVFGSISIKNNKGKSLAGIITGAVGIILFAVILIFIIAVTPKGIEQLQISQRDTQRKNDVAILASDITSYMSNNRGQLPDNDWLSGMTYELSYVKSTTDGGQSTANSAAYKAGEDCNGNKSVRNFAVTVLLESGTDYCQGS